MISTGVGQTALHAGTEPDLIGDASQLLIGVGVLVGARHDEIVRGTAEIGDDREITERFEFGEFHLDPGHVRDVHRLFCDRPLHHRHRIAHQRAHVLTLDSDDQEELITHQDKTEYATLTGELSECMQQVLHRVGGVHRERDRIPLAFLAPGCDDVVDLRLFHIPMVAPRSLDHHYSAHMETLVVDHPLVAHKLGRLRAEDTSSATFRLLAEELVTLLAYEATENLDVVPVEITTPVAACTGVEIAEPKPLVVPILRAGLGMLNGMVKLMPTAEVGFLGMIRDESTLEATTYADRLPHDISNRHVFLLDPMLATGGTLVAAIDLLLERGAKDVTAICLIASPEGIARLEAAYADRDLTVRVVTAGVDEGLNEVGYIVPGLGDAGDRLYGTV